jgi:AraC-like DNA-binding protein
LYDRAAVSDLSNNVVWAWKPAVTGVREVLHARFADHAYPRHTHDVWTLFVVDDGAVEYDLDRARRIALPSMVSVLPPNVPHDGRPATKAGYRKRAIYIETSILDERLTGLAVDAPAIRDARARRSIAAFDRALRCPDDSIEAEELLHEIAARIQSHFGVPGPRDDRSRASRHATELRAYLDANLFNAPTIVTLARELDASAAQLTRAFIRAFAIPPHEYVDGRRLEIARRRILDGQPLADVAAELGYVDQAHLTRRFRKFLGTTPGRYVRSGRRPRG